MRLAAGAMLAVAFVVFGVQVGRWQHECNVGINCGDGPAHYILPIGGIVLGVAAVALLVAVLARAAVSLVRRRPVAVVPTTAAVLVGCALGLVAATPVTEGWNDGCNSSVGRMPTIGSVQLGQGDLDPVDYDTISTAMLCP